ncbi:MAG: HepT-like ribonuclease domain-containing protein [Actinomycetota bacterium]
MNRDRDFLLDILDLIEKISRYRPTNEAIFIEDEVLLTAVIHRVQTIGEAAAGVSSELRLLHSEVPWREVIDTRNLLAHGYRIVDPSIVWQVVVRDLPRLQDQISAIVAGLD